MSEKIGIKFDEKYRPKTSSDVIGNKSQIYEIKEWLENYSANRIKFYKEPKKRKKIKTIIVDDDDENFDETVELKKPRYNTGNHSCLIVVGDHGVGKTCTVLAILNQLGYMVQTVNLSKIGSNKNVIENVNKLTVGSNVYDKLNDEKKGKMAVVIDEIESAISPVEKNFILMLLKKNEERWYFPIIFISSGKHSRFNTTIKTNSNVVSFYRPTNDVLMKLLCLISVKEKMCFEDESVGYAIVEYCQGDFRRLTSILQDLKTTHSNKQITKAHILDYCKMCKRKDTDIDIYRATTKMLIGYESIDDCLRLYEGEKVIIPLVMHQNYIKCINDYLPHGTKAFKLVNSIAKSMAYGDMIEDYIYSDQNWDMKEVHGFLTCITASYKLHKQKLIVHPEYLKKALEFPYDLNRTSIKQINKRNVTNSNNCLKNMEIKDFIFANRLIRQMIADEKIEECAGLFSKYGAKVENIESILKIDKINETKTVIPTQVKKKLAQLLAKQKA
jgi:DNA polymerase III delta prime subunit